MPICTELIVNIIIIKSYHIPYDLNMTHVVQANKFYLHLMS